MRLSPSVFYTRCDTRIIEHSGEGGSEVMEKAARRGGRGDEDRGAGEDEFVGDAGR